MKTTEETVKITKLTAAKGKVLTNGEVYSTEVYLGKYDSVDNWREIDESEAPSEPVPEEIEQTDE